MALNRSAHTKSSKFEEQKKQLRGDVALIEAGPKGGDLSVEVVSFLFWHRTHAQNMLTCCTNTHGE